MIEKNLPQWRQLLKSAQKKEGNPQQSKWIQIATTNKAHNPRVRTVVFRGWIDDTSMLIFTDKRSDKVEDLKNNNNVEILWLFLKSRSQFRFKGKAEIVEENSFYWNNLSNESKKLWFWPDPGKMRNSEYFKNIIEPNISSNFLVLRINIDETELLKLSKPIHSRSVWKKDHNWECLELNP